MELQDFITVQDAARRLGVTPSRVYQLIRENLIKSDEVGEESKVILVAKEELNRYIKSIEQKKQRNAKI